MLNLSNYSRDYSLNCTPLGPITIINHKLVFVFNFNCFGDLKSIIFGLFTITRRFHFSCLRISNFPGRLAMFAFAKLNGNYDVNSQLDVFKK